jgi:hypothetical protein
MRIHQTAHYRIKPESQTSVEQAMHKFAARLKRDFPQHSWWTARNPKDQLSYLTVIVSPDEQINEAASKSEATAQFVDALYPNVVGEVAWADWQHVASTGPLAG